MKKTGNIYTVFILVFLCLHSALHTHGFSYHTGILADSGRCPAIGSIKNGFNCVASFANDSKLIDFAVVNAAGSSKTNCYFRLRLSIDQSSCGNEILCTPTQLFYSPSKNIWVPALDLQVGDELLGMHSTVERIAYIEFVNKPLEVHTIEVKKNHNFFVGCRHHAVLTHNMLAPVSLWAGLSIAFGQGAAVGGGAGSFFGPVTIVGGIVIGGLVSVAVHSLWQSNFKYSLAFNAPGICEYKLKSNDAVYIDDNTCYFKPREL